jgi:hypothetical protein
MLCIFILPVCSYAATSEFKLSAEGLVSSDHPHLGTSVAIDGDYAVVGAFENDTNGVPDAGAAFIFKKEGDTWTQQAMLAGTWPVYCHFGYAVAIHNNFAVIGAPGDAYHGKAYVYRLEGTAWVLHQVLEIEDPVLFDRFGASVAIFDDHIVVGAPQGDWPRDDDDPLNRSNDEGSVYVFKLENDRWDLEAMLIAPDGKRQDNFGQQVDIDKDYILVSGFHFPHVYVFKEMEGRWGLISKLNIPDGDLAYSVAIEGDTALIGAPAHKINDGLYGAVHVFSNEHDKWRFDTTITAGYGDSYDYWGYGLQFGCSVDIKGDYMMIGAPGDGLDVGAAYLFERKASKWFQKEKIKATDGSTGCNFGQSVSLSNSSAIVGSPKYNLDWARGAAYIYKNYDYAKKVPYLSATPPFVEVNAAEGTFEINIKNEGFSDLEWNAEASADWLEIVKGQSGINDGNVVVRFSRNTGCIRNATITLFAPESPNDRQIIQVRQVDGTGFDMVKINIEPNGYGSPVAIDIPYAAIASRGGLLIYKLDNGIWRLQTTIPSEISVFSLDILDDYMILGNNTVQGSKGEANVYKKEGDTWLLQTTLSADDGKWDDYFGTAISMSGQYAVIGSPYAKPYGIEQGAVYVFKRDGDAWIQKQILIDQDGSPDDYFGYSVSISEDRIIAGAYHDNSCSGFYCPIGSASIYQNRNDHWVLEKKLRAPDMLYSLDWFGYSVSIKGGLAIVGQPYGRTDYYSEAGIAHIFSSDDNWNTPYTMALSDRSQEHFGIYVSQTEKYALIADCLYAYILKDDGSFWKLHLFDKDPISCHSTGNLSYSNSLIDTSGDYAILSVHDSWWEQAIYIANLSERGDRDNDGIADSAEKKFGTDPNDADSDDDGILDGFEDINRNGYRDKEETDPRLADTDGDGIQDGTELGYTMNAANEYTDERFFIPDNDPFSRTDPNDTDTDSDGFEDGTEDINKNGKVDDEEFDPNIVDVFLNCGNNYSIAEAIMILKNLNSSDQIIGEYKDINGDNKIGIAEVIYLLQKIACVRR